MSWLTDYKARRLMENHKIGLRDAKKVIKRNFNFNVRVPSKNVSDAVEFLDHNQSTFMLCGMGYIFSDDQEAITAVKMLYT